MQQTEELLCRDKLHQAARALAMVLRSRDGALRKVARASLVAIGPLAVSPLIECLSADSKAARWEATKALGQIADPSAARALVGVLEDDDFGVRWLAADALTRLGVSGLEPLLGERCQARADRLQKCSRLSLVRWTRSAERMW